LRLDLKPLFFILVLVALLLTPGCLESNNTLTPPFTTSQFVNKATDLNYTDWKDGDYNNMVLVFDGNKISVADASDLNVKKNIYLDGNFFGNQIYGEDWNKSDTGFETVDLVTTDVYVRVRNLTAGLNNGFTVSDGNLIAIYSGVYQVNAKIGAKSVAVGGDNGMKVFVNDVGQNQCYDHESTNQNNMIGFIIAGCMVRLNAGDKVNIRFDDHMNPVSDLVLYNANVNILRVGN